MHSGPADSVYSEKQRLGHALVLPADPVENGDLAENFQAGIKADIVSVAGVEGATQFERPMAIAPIARGRDVGGTARGSGNLEARHPSFGFAFSRFDRAETSFAGIEDAVDINGVAAFGFVLGRILDHRQRNPVAVIGGRADAVAAPSGPDPDVDDVIGVGDHRAVVLARQLKPQGEHVVALLAAAVLAASPLPRAEISVGGGIGPARANIDFVLAAADPQFDLDRAGAIALVVLDRGRDGDPVWLESLPFPKVAVDPGRERQSRDVDPLLGAGLSGRNDPGEQNGRNKQLHSHWATTASAARFGRTAFHRVDIRFVPNLRAIPLTE